MNAEESEEVSRKHGPFAPGVRNPHRNFPLITQGNAGQDGPSP